MNRRDKDIKFAKLTGKHILLHRDLPAFKEFLTRRNVKQMEPAGQSQIWLFEINGVFQAISSNKSFDCHWTVAAPGRFLLQAFLAEKAKAESKSAT